MDESLEEEPEQVREMLNSRYDEIVSGKVKPIDGEEAIARLKAAAQRDLNGQGKSPRIPA